MECAVVRNEERPYDEPAIVLLVRAGLVDVNAKAHRGEAISPMMNRQPQRQRFLDFPGIIGSSKRNQPEPGTANSVRLAVFVHD